MSSFAELYSRNRLESLLPAGLLRRLRPTSPVPVSSILLSKYFMSRVVYFVIGV